MNKTYRQRLEELNQAVIDGYNLLILYLFERRLMKHKRDHKLMRIRGNRFDITAMERQEHGRSIR